MKPETVEKVPMLWLVAFTTSLTITALERGMSIYMHADNCKQKQLHDTEFCMSHSHEQAYQHHPVIPPCWPYKVCTRLVLWPVQVRLQTNEGGEFAIHRSCCQHLRRVQLCPVIIHGSCSNIQLDGLLCHTDEEDSRNQKVSPLQDVILFTWRCVCKGIQWFSRSHIQTTEGTLDFRCCRVAHCHFTTWAKRWSSVAFVWLHPTVLPRWWQRHCLPTAINPEVLCQQRGYSKLWPHERRTSFTTQKRKQTCGICKQKGHDRRSCLDK